MQLTRAFNSKVFWSFYVDPNIFILRSKCVCVCVCVSEQDGKAKVFLPLLPSFLSGPNCS